MTLPANDTFYGDRCTSTPPPLPPPTPQADTFSPTFVLSHYLHCCGIKELKGISYVKPQQAVQDFCFQRTAPEIIVASYITTSRDLQAFQQLRRQRFGCAFVLFTQAYAGDRTDGYGDTLSAFIHTHGLGDVTIGGKGVNPNTGNIVTVYLWKVNHNALERWWGENPISPAHREQLLKAHKMWNAEHLL